MRREIGCNDRRPHGQCFDQRQTEPFGERRYQQRLSMCDEPPESGARQAAREDYLTLQRLAPPLQLSEQRGDTPDGRSHHDQPGGVLAPLPDQLAPNVQQQKMVLARLDRSTYDKVIVLTEFLVGPIFLEKYWWNRERRCLHCDLDLPAQPKRV